MISEILVLSYFSGLIIFYGTTVPLVYGAVLRCKKYATFPVVGALIGLSFCVLGFAWNCDPDIRCFVVPAVILGTISWMPIVSFLCLILAKKPLLVKIRNAAAITAFSMFGFVIQWSCDSLGLKDAMAAAMM